MKKIFCIASVLLVSALGSFAQSGLGVKGGLNLTSISTNAGSLSANITNSYNTRTGFVLGVWGRLGDKFFVQPEIMLASKGGDIGVVKNGVNSVVNAKYTDIDIPVLVGFRPLGSLYVVGGPVASLNISQDQATLDALKAYASNPTDAFKKSTFGYQVGIGAKVLGINLDLRRQGSLTSISNLNIPNEPKFNQMANGWQLTAGIRIL